MIDLPLGKLASASMRINGFGQMLTFFIGQKAGALKLGGDDTPTDISNACDDVLLVAEALGGMPVSRYAAHGLKHMLAGIKPDRTASYTIDLITVRRLNDLTTSLSMAIRTEADARVAVVIPGDKLSFYEPKEPLFGTEVKDRFKSAAYDITEAGKCLALGRSTAAVFHLMHVVEIALRAMHACLGLTPPDNPSWGIWLKQIRDDRVRRGDRKWPENDYFQDVYSRLDAIKDAQRDPTLHVQTIHTEEEAELIFRNTKAFMKKIASRMDEEGEPKA